MGETGEPYLVVWQKDQNTFELHSNLETMGDEKYVVGFSLYYVLDYWQDAVQHGTGGGHGTYTDNAGKEVMVAYNQLALSGLDWYLISKIDKYEVTAPIRATYFTIGLVAGGLVLLIGLGTVLFSRSITRPIIADMEFAQAERRTWRSGHLTEQYGPKSPGGEPAQHRQKRGLMMNSAVNTPPPSWQNEVLPFLSSIWRLRQEPFT